MGTREIQKEGWATFGVEIAPPAMVRDPAGADADRMEAPKNSEGWERTRPLLMARRDMVRWCAEGQVGGLVVQLFGVYEFKVSSLEST